MPGWKTWAALEEVTAANMNSFVRDQTIQVFTSSSARSAAITAPTRGLVSLLTDTGAIEIYYGATTGWARAWTEDWGVVSTTTDTTTRSATTSSVVNTTCTWTGTPPANRRYRATAYFNLNCSSGVGLGRVYLHNGSGAAGALAYVDHYHTAVNQLAIGSISWQWTTTAVSTTVTLGIASPLGTSTQQIYAATPDVPRMYVEDMGPASATAPLA